MPLLDELKTLYLQNNRLTSLTGLGSQPALQEIDLRNNELTSLAGSRPLPRLRSVRLEGNPVAGHVHARAMVLLAFGFQIRSIDGVRVTGSEVAAARSLAGSTVDAVRAALAAGWLLDLHPRSLEEWEDLVAQLQQPVASQIPTPLIPVVPGPESQFVDQSQSLATSMGMGGGGGWDVWTGPGMSIDVVGSGGGGGGGGGGFLDLEAAFVQLGTS